jgi:hypothetical protein
MKKIKFGFGANESLKDSRTVQHDEIALISEPLISGGIDYSASDIENQHQVGICTAISLVQNRQKKNGKKYSPDFQYLMQKRIFDKNWYEGSSIFSALKVAKNIGFLPIELFTYITEEDRSLPYSKYIKKLQAIPNAEIDRLAGVQDSTGKFIGGLCVDKIAGYAEVDVTDNQKIAKAINNSGVGILCRYVLGKEWYTGVDGSISYLPKDIDPLRPPVVVISGHAIGMNKFNYTEESRQVLNNTWGNYWDREGCANIIWEAYKPTEGWIILDEAPAIPSFQFLINLSYGMTSPDIKQLQIMLNKDPATLVAQSGAGSIGNETEYFGTRTLSAVKRFQKINNLPTTGFVGPMTRKVLNEKLKVG